jgi:hypothetical protein
MLHRMIRCVGLILLGISVPLAKAEEAILAAVDQYDQRVAELEAAVSDLQKSRVRAVDRATDQPALYVGYTFLFSKLHYKESFQATVSDFATGTMELVPFEGEYELTPRVWIGLRAANGIGVRGSYWSFDHAGDDLNLVSNGVRIPAATSTSVIFPALIVAPFPGDRLSVGTSMEATTFDLEGTYDVRLRRAEATLGAGLRYANTDQAYDATVIPGPVPGATPASLQWVRQFEGFGPLLTAQGMLPIGNSGFYGRGGVNVSFLFGEKTLRRTVFNDATPPPNTGMPVVLFDDSDEITGIYGANIGLGWQRHGDVASLLIEGTYEGQLWTEGGAPTITFAGFEGLGLTLGLAI